MLLLFLLLAAAADDVDLGIRACNAGDYTTALRLLKPAAQNQLAIMYESGWGVKQDRGSSIGALQKVCRSELWARFVQPCSRYA